MKAKKPRHSEATKKRARQLRRDGLTYPQIAAEVGASEGTVYYWLNPRYAADVKASSRRWKEENPEQVRQNRSEYWRRNKGRISAKDRDRRRRASALMAKQRERRETTSAVTSATPPVSEAYALVRKALQVLDRAERPPSRDGRLALNAAAGALQTAEDALVDAGKAAA